ncbi:MAG TPA: 30S ribosomal protein S9 [Candidatus Nanoarchaeia archaeon]|nr:30S ribosomal protein S9 [Candidatus Nanoarchaeia archaeon]
MKPIMSSGKRKRAIARASLKEGKGVVRINNVLLDLYEPKMYRLKLREPLILAGDIVDKINIDVNVFGGGIASQSEASRLAIARALNEYAKSDKLKEKFLKYDRQLLVADIRRHEPSKPNRQGQARAKKQKSYR